MALPRIILQVRALFAAFTGSNPDFAAPLTATDVHLSGTEGDSVSVDMKENVSGGTPPYTFTVS